MKTLDEVINIMEGCGLIDWGADALHYLKEFKRISAKLEKIALGNITETLEKLDNPALDWQELKQMEGKPVWVELTYPEGGYSHWGIIEGFPKAGYEFMTLRGFHQIDSFSIMAKEQGKTWQAYRKERK